MKEHTENRDFASGDLPVVDREKRDWLADWIERYENHRIGTEEFCRELEKFDWRHARDSLLQSASELWEWFGDEPENPSFTREDFSELLVWKLALKTDRQVSTVTIHPEKKSYLGQLALQFILLLAVVFAGMATFYRARLPFYGFLPIWIFCGAVSEYVILFVPYRWKGKNLERVEKTERFFWFSSYSDIASLMRIYKIRKTVPEKKKEPDVTDRIGAVIQGGIFGGIVCLMVLCGTLSHYRMKLRTLPCPEELQNS